MSKHNTVSQDSGAEELSPDGFKARAERKPPVDGFHQGEEQFRLLVEATTEYAIFVLDPEGFIVSWNAGAERIKGYTAEEILSRHFSVFYPEERVQEGVPEQVLEAAARDGVWTDEGWRLRKDGTRFWAHVTITALEDDEGGLRGFAKVTRDLTDQKEHEDELAQQMQRAERQNALLRLMQTVASASNDAESLEEALRMAVDAVCKHTGWPVGHAYRRAERGSELIPTGFWHVSDEGRYDTFKAVTARTRFGAGAGMPGRVSDSGEPAWIADVLDDPSFVRAQLTDDLGVRGAFAFPVRALGEVVAVLEFFSPEPQVPDEELLEAMGSVGVQLGRVAEREKSQEELRRSEVRYRQLFEASQEGIAITTPAGEIVDINSAGLAILGYSEEELRGLNAADLYVDPEERQKAAKIVAEEGAVRGFELHLYRKGGEEIICRLSSVARRGPDGEIEAYETFFHDVTEERRAQTALEESEAKFRALAEESPTGITVIQDGRFKYVNETYAEIFGYDREEMIDTFPVETVVHPDDRPVVRENMRRRVEGEVDAVQFQARGLTKDRDVLELDIRGRRFIYQGKPAVIGSVLDITEQKRAQEALQESEEKFRELAENALIGIGLLQDGIYKYVNPALARIGGYSPEELIGESPEIFFHPDDWPGIRERVRRRIEGEVQEAHYQARAQAKDGQIRRVEVLGRRITYQGKPAIIGTMLDITERRRLQREVLRAQEEERRRLGQDLHDGVASQLTGVAISLGLLARRMEDDDLTSRVEEVQALVQESCDNVRRLSRGLSPAGIAESGLSGALERLSENVEEGCFESDGELPELQEDEAAHLYWIAQEAVTNARKYAEAEQIVIRLACGGDALVLEVEDDGKGFVPGEVEQGGLGLRSMQYRADLLGAAFIIDSDSGEGTRVVCRLSL